MVVPWPEKLGHYQFKKYGEFVDRVLERFEQKDTELSFKELAQLNQVGILIEYMLEFQRLSIKVSLRPGKSQVTKVRDSPQ